MEDVFFIIGQSDHQWVKNLRLIGHNLGKSSVLVSHENFPNIYQDCELFILDTGAVADDLISIIKRIRSSNAKARIVVVSPAPHWKEARETLLAGASDYRRKIDDKGNNNKYFAW